MKLQMENLRKNIKKSMFRAGAVILLFIMLFSFVLPFIYPYDNTDVFFVTKRTTVELGEACVNDELRFYSLETCSAPSDLIMLIEKSVSDGLSEFSVLHENCTYNCKMIIDDVYLISCGEELSGVATNLVIDFYDADENVINMDSENYARLLMTVDDELVVYNSDLVAIGELSKYIIRSYNGKDVFSFEQKRELQELLFNDKGITSTVYSKSLDCELIISADAESISFKKYEDKSIIDTYGKPSAKHILGTDANGMDVLARLMYGGRISLIVGLIASFTGVMIGSLIGCMSGLKMGITDSVLMRFVDIFDSLPSLPILMIVGNLISDLFLSAKFSILVMIIVITFFSWTQTAKVVRMKVIGLNSGEDSSAADISGINNIRKVYTVILPGIVPQIVSFFFIGIGSVILTESSVSFFGLGVRFPYSTWGLMLSSNTTVNELDAHPMIWLPVVSLICLTVIACYLIGESFIREKDFEDYYNVGSVDSYRSVNLSEKSENILEIENLKVEFSLEGEIHTVVKDFSLTLKRGDAVALLGASGCGKSVTADAITGLLSRNGTVKNGKVVFKPSSVNKRIGYILQEPMSCFDPIMTVGKQLEESLIISEPSLDKSERYFRVLEILKKLGFSDPEKIYRMYPGQLSGGMCQRIMAAVVLLQKPELIVADEPCSSLDTHSKLIILNLLKEAVLNGCSLIIITHSIYEAKYITDNIISFDGKDRAVCDMDISVPVEVFENDGFCKDEICLTVNNLSKTYKNSKFRTNALSDVSFVLKKGRILGIAGDEGCGKTTLAGVLAGIVHAERGSVIYQGKNIAGVRANKRKKMRGKIQLVFQHPYNSLSKGICVGKQIQEVVRATGIFSKKDEYQRVVELFKDCGLDETFYYRCIDTLSGGQCKRICIARALASNPDILICDEPLAYLDTELYERIVVLLKQLVKKYSMSMIFISHDLDSLKAICDDIVIMDNGTIAEQGPVHKVLKSPESECAKRMIEENNLLKNNISQR